MARCTKLVAGALVLCLLLGPPGLAWYKPSAGPRHYSVGRAAGLLSGFRGVQSARRSEPVVGVGSRSRAGASGELRPGLPTLASARGGLPMAMCIQDVTPHLHSCERLHEDRGTLQCTADVFLSLRAYDCRPTSALDLKPGPAWPWWVPLTPTVPSPDPQPRRGDGAPHPPTPPSHQ